MIPSRRIRAVKILLVKLGHLGDTLLLTPTLRFLKQKFPQATLDVMVRSGCEELLHGNPDVAQILPIGSPEKHNRSLAKELSESARAFSRIARCRRNDCTPARRCDTNTAGEQRHAARCADGIGEQRAFLRELVHLRSVFTFEP